MNELTTSAFRAWLLEYVTLVPSAATTVEG